MHIHILGICGTFMGSLAQLAREKGLQVTGCDANVYPPMSTQLETAGIQLIEGFGLDQLDADIDLYVIGNSMSRGNPLVEAILDRGLPYISGPQFFAEHILPGKWVLGVAGTHGKTTTTSMLAWILEYAGFEPGFLIGGVPKNFGISARLGASDFFVVEADEYDSAFFDKRSKFVHYHLRTTVLNNLEFDHADIFDTLGDIQRQFHHLIKTIPSNGMILYPPAEKSLGDVLQKGVWSPVQTLGIDTQNGDGSDVDWRVEALSEDFSRFQIHFEGHSVATVNWALSGRHNMMNGLAALAAARHVGVLPDVAAQALNRFSGVKRRMEVLAQLSGVTIYDDFAHHPSAIDTTLDGLRRKVGADRIIAVIEPRSNTMKMGVHQQTLASSVEKADRVFWFQPAGVQWSLQQVVEQSRPTSTLMNSIAELVTAVAADVVSTAGETHVVIMSNGGFGGFHQKLIAQLQENQP